MTIEEAEEILKTTNYSSFFANEAEKRAFYMAYRALQLIYNHKKLIKVLDRMKGDHIAQVISNTYKEEINLLEGSGDNGKQ